MDECDVKPAENEKNDHMHRYLWPKGESTVIRCIVNHYTNANARFGVTKTSKLSIYLLINIDDYLFHLTCHKIRSAK